MYNNNSKYVKYGRGVRSRKGLLFLTAVTGVSTAFALVIFKVKASCITSVDGIGRSWMLLVVCQFSRDVIGNEDSIVTRQLGFDSFCLQKWHNILLSTFRLVLKLCQLLFSFILN